MSVMQGDELERFVTSVMREVILVDIQGENSSGVCYRVELPKFMEPEAVFTIGYIKSAGQYGWSGEFMALDCNHEMVDGKVVDLDAATESVVRSWATEDDD